MRTVGRFHERSNFAKEDWGVFLQLMKSCLIDKPHDGSDSDNSGDSDKDVEPYLEDTFQNVKSNEEIGIDMVHKILLDFDKKMEIDVKDLLKETVAALLRNASPRVYRHRFD